MTTPKSPQTAAVDHAASFSVGDPVDYRGALGSLRGTIADVRVLFDEGGRRLHTFFVAVEGAVERIHTSADALFKVERTTVPANVAIPRSAYTDTSVEPVVDDRTGVDPADVPDAPFDEPKPATRTTRRKV